MAKQTLYDGADKRLRKWAGTVGAAMTLITAIGGAYAWASNQFTSAVSNQIQEFREEVTSSNAKQEQSITRVELLMLMEHDPENIVAIEKMARYYFQELKGDLWMTAKYSEWARQYGGDTEIVVGVH